ncbi:ABC transporter substrate-binding protein [Microlunatus capsulatus]|uniref:Iron complex transport system substrate-binding protein n=1 Tax=Microlunatus capsulatus TaxID=99117 RepID=A0ABS4Z256_9ACTN|nr:ABC transporter substrate-binding protein [Microlunatus capsulatus]MBP2415134.1 iron complex transport system substrate-binding protein [Microlunatus capsulatus]
MSEVSRRALLGGLLGTTTLPAACGRASEDGTPGPGGATAAGGTRTVESARGPVEIPRAPRRVVCTDFYSTYALLDVGFTPVGTAEATVGGVLPAQQAAYDALTKVGTTTELRYEAIAALTPDLVLGTLVPGLAEDLPEKLAAIAPTALFAASSPGDWKQRAVRAADAVGRRAEGEALARAYDARVAELRSTHAEPLGRLTWALVRASTDGTVFVDGATSWSGVVLADLGARLTAAAPADVPTTPISAERYDGLADADVVLSLADATGRPDPRTADALGQAAFTRTVDAARQVPLSSYYAAHYLDGQAVLDQVEAVLEQS